MQDFQFVHSVSSFSLTTTTFKATQQMIL